MVNDIVITCDIVNVNVVYNSKQFIINLLSILKGKDFLDEMDSTYHHGNEKLYRIIHELHNGSLFACHER